MNVPATRYVDIETDDGYMFADNSLHGQFNAALLFGGFSCTGCTADGDGEVCEGTDLMTCVWGVSSDGVDSSDGADGSEDASDAADGADGATDEGSDMTDMSDGATDATDSSEGTDGSIGSTCLQAADCISTCLGDSVCEGEGLYFASPEASELLDACASCLDAYCPEDPENCFSCEQQATACLNG